jgi:bifunctional non-homologous end joining protein LigD
MRRPIVQLSSLEKVLWPATGFTKGQMLDYYRAVAPTLLPHLVDRPLTLGRFPDGLAGQGFAQLECRGSPEWMTTAAIRLRDGRLRNFCLARDLDSLLWIANLGTIELHIFLGRASTLEQPTAVLFDLDPEPPAQTADARRAALLLRDWLRARDLTAVVKTTGGIGLHVLVPLNCRHTYSQTRSFARQGARELASEHDWIVDSAAHRDLRSGTVLIDWAQNSERRSMVAPYSLRATDVPSVSTPVDWEEVERDGTSLRFDPTEAIDRIARFGDEFGPALTLVQRVAGADRV